MEDNNSMNSCLMLAVGLYTPVELGSIFDSADYKGTGLELDSHITLLYAQGKILPRKLIKEDINTILGEDGWESLTELCSGTSRIKVFDLFELSSFENDSDYLVLKMKKDMDPYPMLKLVNTGLRKKYKVSSEFADYSPHITLAQLNPGTVNKYLESECLRNVLRDSVIDFEDIVISFGYSGEENDRKQYFLTQYKNIDRYFRLSRLKEWNKDLE